MRMDTRWCQTWSVAACALALLTTTIGTALAAAPSTIAYHFSSQPMISGTVVTVNDREMVVDTDQGEQVTLNMDSRTMAPRDLAPGMVMRAEFLALEDCRFYAQRIIAIRSGMSTDRLQAYANTHASGEALAGNASALGGSRQASAESRGNLPQASSESSPGPSMKATPTTVDYLFSTRPMISGRVVSVNDHWLVVETEQGQQVGLVMDSHTMVPGEVAPGTIMRAQFTQMKDGRYYAQRISEIGSGVAGREQAYAQTRDSDIMIASSPPDCGFVSTAARSTVTSAVERREDAVTPDAVVAQSAPAPVVAQSAPEPVVESPKTLPQTASHQPLLALLGLLALGTAGVMVIKRRLHPA